MTQEEQELLVQDLCARLPYGVQGITSEGEVSPLLTRGEADWDILTSLNYRIVKYGWKPYLRPISNWNWNIGSKDTKDALNYFDWLNRHNFDYRGLIEKGLAIEAPEGMYKR